MVAWLLAAGAVLLLATPSITAASTDDLCYQVSWDLASPGGPKTRLVRPVVRIPEDHALTQRFCGVQRNAGDLIPASGLWSETGAINDSPGGDCAAVSGGRLFYGYNYPNPFSANTGFETGGVGLLYFVVDESEALSLVLTLDKPNSGNAGGNMVLRVDSPDIVPERVGAQVNISLQDDPGSGAESCYSSIKDCYDWDPASAKGLFYWTWGKCCSDGMVMAALPPSGFRYNLDVERLNGLEHFRFVSFNATRNGLDFIDFTAEQVLAGGIEVAALTCPDYCSLRTTCGKCAAADGCGWCPSTATCQHVSASDTCAASLVADDGCCSTCAVYTSCSACASNDGCGWSFDRGLCLSGTASSGLCGGSEWSAYGAATPNATDVCDAIPPGAVLDLAVTTAYRPSADNTPVITWCSAHGTADFSAATCTCDAGWWGADCSQECPGGSAAPCSGHGTCDVDTGVCFCDCDFGGADCSGSGCPCLDDEDVLSTCHIFTPAEGCAQICGRNTSTGCSAANASLATGGRRVEGSACTCADGWYGSTCTDRCPGVQPDGSGKVCGGHGTCDVVTGSCVCDACYTVDGGVCVVASLPDEAACANGGIEVCGTDGTITCACPGQWTGPTCSDCACQYNGTCNAVTGACDCAPGSGRVGPQCEFLCTRSSLCHGHGECATPVSTDNSTALASPLAPKCDCDADYIGVGATQQCAFHCPPNHCSFNGICSPHTGECLCNVGYYGSHCDNPTPTLDAFTLQPAALVPPGTVPVAALADQDAFLVLAGSEIAPTANLTCFYTEALRHAYRLEYAVPAMYLSPRAVECPIPDGDVPMRATLSISNDGITRSAPSPDLELFLAFESCAHPPCPTGEYLYHGPMETDVNLPAGYLRLEDERMEDVVAMEIHSHTLQGQNRTAHLTHIGLLALEHTVYVRLAPVPASDGQPEPYNPILYRITARLPNSANDTFRFGLEANASTAGPVALLFPHATPVTLLLDPEARMPCVGGSTPPCAMTACPGFYKHPAVPPGAEPANCAFPPPLRALENAVASDDTDDRLGQLNVTLALWDAVTGVESILVHLVAGVHATSQLRLVATIPVPLILDLDRPNTVMPVLPTLAVPLLLQLAPEELAHATHFRLVPASPVAEHPELAVHVPLRDTIGAWLVDASAANTSTEPKSGHLQFEGTTWADLLAVSFSDTDGLGGNASATVTALQALADTVSAAVNAPAPAWLGLAKPYLGLRLHGGSDAGVEIAVTGTLGKHPAGVALDAAVTGMLVPGAAVAGALPDGGSAKATLLRAPETALCPPSYAPLAALGSALANVSGLTRGMPACIATTGTACDPLHDWPYALAEALPALSACVVAAACPAPMMRGASGRCVLPLPTARLANLTLTPDSDARAGWVAGSLQWRKLSPSALSTVAALVVLQVETVSALDVAAGGAPVRLRWPLAALPLEAADAAIALTPARILAELPPTAASYELPSGGLRTADGDALVVLLQSADGRWHLTDVSVAPLVDSSNSVALGAVLPLRFDATISTLTALANGRTRLNAATFDKTTTLQVAAQDARGHGLADFFSDVALQLASFGPGAVRLRLETRVGDAVLFTLLAVTDAPAPSNPAGRLLEVLPLNVPGGGPKSGNAADAINAAAAARVAALLATGDPLLLHVTRENHLGCPPNTVATAAGALCRTDLKDQEAAVPASSDSDASLAQVGPAASCAGAGELSVGALCYAAPRCAGKERRGPDGVCYPPPAAVVWLSDAKLSDQDPRFGVIGQGNMTFTVSGDVAAITRFHLWFASETLATVPIAPPLNATDASVARSDVTLDMDTRRAIWRLPQLAVPATRAAILWIAAETAEHGLHGGADNATATLLDDVGTRPVAGGPWYFNASLVPADARAPAVAEDWLAFDAPRWAEVTALTLRTEHTAAAAAFVRLGDASNAAFAATAAARATLATPEAVALVVAAAAPAVLFTTADGYHVRLAIVRLRAQPSGTANTVFIFDVLPLDGVMGAVAGLLTHGDSLQLTLGAPSLPCHASLENDATAFITGCRPAVDNATGHCWDGAARDEASGHCTARTVCPAALVWDDGAGDCIAAAPGANPASLVATTDGDSRRGYVGVDLAWTTVPDDVRDGTTGYAIVGLTSGELDGPHAVLAVADAEGAATTALVNFTLSPADVAQWTMLTVVARADDGAIRLVRPLPTVLVIDGAAADASLLPWKLEWQVSGSATAESNASLPGGVMAFDTQAMPAVTKLHVSCRDRAGRDVSAFLNAALVPASVVQLRLNARVSGAHVILALDAEEDAEVCASADSLILNVQPVHVYMGPVSRLFPHDSVLVVTATSSDLSDTASRCDVPAGCVAHGGCWEGAEQAPAPCEVARLCPGFETAVADGPVCAEAHYSLSAAPFVDENDVLGTVAGALSVSLTTPYPVEVNARVAALRIYLATDEIGSVAGRTLVGEVVKPVRNLLPPVNNGSLPPPFAVASRTSSATGELTPAVPSASDRTLDFRFVLANLRLTIEQRFLYLVPLEDEGEVPALAVALSVIDRGAVGLGNWRMAAPKPDPAAVSNGQLALDADSLVNITRLGVHMVDAAGVNRSADLHRIAAAATGSNSSALRLVGPGSRYALVPVENGATANSSLDLKVKPPAGVRAAVAHLFPLDALVAVVADSRLPCMPGAALAPDGACTRPPESGSGRACANATATFDGARCVELPQCPGFTHRPVPGGPCEEELARLSWAPWLDADVDLVAGSILANLTWGDANDARVSQYAVFFGNITHIEGEQVDTALPGTGRSLLDSSVQLSNWTHVYVVPGTASGAQVPGAAAAAVLDDRWAGEWILQPEAASVLLNAGTGNGRLAADGVGAAAGVRMENIGIFVLDVVDNAGVDHRAEFEALAADVQRREALALPALQRHVLLRDTDGRAAPFRLEHVGPFYPNGTVRLQVLSLVRGPLARVHTPGSALTVLLQVGDRQACPPETDDGSAGSASAYTPALGRCTAPARICPATQRPVALGEPCLPDTPVCPSGHVFNATLLGCVALDATSGSVTRCPADTALMDAEPEAGCRLPLGCSSAFALVLAAGRHGPTACQAQRRCPGAYTRPNPLDTCVYPPPAVGVSDVRVTITHVSTSRNVAEGVVSWTAPPANVSDITAYVLYFTRDGVRPFGSPIDEVSADALVYRFETDNRLMYGVLIVPRNEGGEGLDAAQIADVPTAIAEYGNESDGSDDAAGLIGAIAAIVGVLLLLLFLAMRRRSKQHESQETKDASEPLGDVSAIGGNSRPTLRNYRPSMIGGMGTNLMNNRMSALLSSASPSSAALSSARSSGPYMPMPGGARRSTVWVVDAGTPSSYAALQDLEYALPPATSHNARKPRAARKATVWLDPGTSHGSNQSSNGGLDRAALAAAIEAAGAAPSIGTSCSASGRSTPEPPMPVYATVSRGASAMSALGVTAQRPPAPPPRVGSSIAAGALVESPFVFGDRAADKGSTASLTAALLAVDTGEEDCFYPTRSWHVFEAYAADPAPLRRRTVKRN